MKIPQTLCRVTYQHRLVDQDGYLLSHETKQKGNGSYTDNINKIDMRSLPMVHPGEWETIARMFAWHRFREDGSTFQLLTVNTCGSVEVIDNKPHGVLDYGEYLARVHKSSILSEEEYTWVKDDKPMNISTSAQQNWPRTFEVSRGYSPVPVSQIAKE